MRKVISLIVVLFSFHYAFGYTFTGTTPATAGQTYTYTFSDGVVYSSFVFYTSTGTGIVTNPVRNGTTYTCNIQWTTAGTSTVIFSGFGTTKGTYSVTIICPTLTAPSATFTYPNGTSACASLQISYSNAPPLGVTWYWQTSSTGTSTANPSKPYTVTTIGTGTYYLRSYCNGQFGPAQATSAVTVKAIPTVSASNSTICSGAGAGISLLNNLPSTTDTWTVTTSNVTGASNSSGISTASTPYLYGLNQSLTSTVGGTATYNITPSNNGCTGSAINVTATVNPIPGNPTPSNGAICGPGAITLTGSPGANANLLHWYSAASGGSPLETNTSYSTSVSSTTTFYIASYNTSTTCEGSRVAVIATVNPIPTVAASGQSVFTANATSVSITNPNSVSGTSFSWTASQPAGLSGAANGSGASIAQTLNSTSTSNLTATYRITPRANNCDGGYLDFPEIVYANPVVSAPLSGNTINMGATVTLDAGAGYSTYAWKKTTDLTSTLGTAQTFVTSIPGYYQVTVSKSGVIGTGTSAPFHVFAQFETQNLNFIVSNVLQVATSNASRIDFLPVDSLVQTTQYFDGHGRLSQTVTTQGSPSKKDLVVANYWDQFGRESRHYLPFVASEINGRFKPGVIDANGNFASAALNFYYNSADKIADDTRPFAESIPEFSDLNRRLQEYGPGQTWKDNGKYVAHTELLNQDGSTPPLQEKIIAWTVNASGMAVRSTQSNQSVSSGYYLSGQLTIQSTKDEDGKEVREYIDKTGKTILKKVQATPAQAPYTPVPALTDFNGWAQTYYIYDDFGLLRYVLQPELSKSLAQGTVNPLNTELGNFAFIYKYDGRNRMVIKKVPGADSVFMIYDKHDRLILTQDGNQRAGAGNTVKYWTFTKYDQLNRPILTGIKDTTTSTLLTRVQMQAVVDAHFAKTWTSWTETYVGSASGNVHGYTNKAYPVRTGSAAGEVDQNKYRSITYYDTYSFVTDLGITATHNPVQNDITGQTTLSNSAVTGHATGTKINVLGTTTFLYGVTYYDNKFRAVQATTQNNKLGWDRMTNIVDFAGRVLKTKTTHHTSTHSDQTIVRRIIYDHRSRVKQIFHTLNVQPEVLLVQNEYNEIGQLVDKKLYSNDGGSTFKQSVDYRYNIRGWLTSMNNSQLTVNAANNDDTNDLFGMELGYNNSLGTGNGPVYNGNIGAMKWSQNLALATVKDVAYNYSYDALNRITAATYLSNTAGVWANASGSFNESGYVYDLNGNIRNLVRKGNTGATIDNMAYTYGGNQLLYVSDTGGDPLKGFIDGNTSGNDYSYDVNGNMVFDKNKGLTAANAIQYNYLNLPNQVTKSTNAKVTYTYDATGRKLIQQVYNTSGALTKTTDYAGEFIYQGDTLQFINHEEGRIVMKTGTPEYQFHLKDHLGNVRLTFTTLPTTDLNTATLEDANLAAEQTKFLRIINAKRVNSVLFDHTNGASTGYSERLNGSANEKFGVARSVSVMPGDVLRLEVYGKYVDQNSSNWTPAMTTLMGQISSGTAGVVVDGSGYSSSTSSFPYAGLLSTAGSAGGPKAYLNWLIFDRNFAFITGGYTRMTATPKEAGSDVPHERLASPDVLIKQPGYVYIYLSNEETSPVEVYFDDFKVTQIKSPAVQQDDYYPFGLTFNSDSRESTVPQNYLYNGKELQKDLSLNWDDYGIRMYQPELGRFFTQDRFAEMYYPLSHYQYAANNPVMYIDINGDSLMMFKNGTYFGTFDDGKKEMTGFNQTSTIDENGKEKFTGGQNFDFNDYDDDQANNIIGDLKSGNVKLNVLSRSDVNKIVTERSEVEDKNVLSRWYYALTESHGGGRMDYKTDPRVMSGTLNIIGGTAYNEKDAGNYLWGYGMRMMGFMELSARIGAHVHAFTSGKPENNPGSKASNGFTRWFENRSWGGDSDGDQRAIIKGMNDAGTYWNYKKKSLIKLLK